MPLLEHRVRELETKLHKTTGHKHTGGEGDGPILPVGGAVIAWQNVGAAVLSTAYFNNNVTGLTLSNVGSVATLALTSGYVIPTTTQEANWGTAYSQTHVHNQLAALETTGSPAFYGLTIQYETTPLVEKFIFSKSPAWTGMVMKGFAKTGSYEIWAGDDYNTGAAFAIYGNDYDDGRTSLQGNWEILLGKSTSHFNFYGANKVMDLDWNGLLKLNGIFGILEGGSTPTKYTYFQGGNQTIDLTYTLPVAYPTVTGQFLSATDAGVMSWQTVTAPDWVSNVLKWDAAGAKIITVAMTNGDFTTVGAAIAHINANADASATNPYVIYVMPGTYVEGAVNLVLPTHTHVVGADKYSCIVSSSTTTSYVFTVNTDTSLSNITVKGSASTGTRGAIYHLGSRAYIYNILTNMTGGGTQTIDIISSGDNTCIIENVKNIAQTSYSLTAYNNCATVFRNMDMYGQINALDVRSASAGAAFYNCVFTGYLNYNTVSLANYISAYNCTFKSDYRANQNCIYIAGSGANTTTMYNCNISSTGGSGFAVHGIASSAIGLYNCNIVGPIETTDVTVTYGTPTFAGLTSNAGVTISNFSTAGVVHNAVTTGILSSSLIVQADIDAGLYLPDTTDRSNWNTASSGYHVHNQLSELQIDGNPAFGNPTVASLKIKETGLGTHYHIFQGDVITPASDLTWTLPIAYPASSGMVLASTDAGVWSWVAIPGSHDAVTFSSLTGFTLTGQAISYTANYSLPLTADTGKGVTAYGYVDQNVKIASTPTFAGLIVSNFPTHGSNAYLTLTSGNTGNAGILLGDEDSTTPFSIIANNSTNELEITSNTGLVAKFTGSTIIFPAMITAGVLMNAVTTGIVSSTTSLPFALTTTGLTVNGLSTFKRQNDSDGTIITIGSLNYNMGAIGQDENSNKVWLANTYASNAIIDFRIGSIADGATHFRIVGGGQSLLQYGLVINDIGADSDTRIEGDTDTHLFFADASLDRIGIGVSSGTYLTQSKLQVGQHYGGDFSDPTILQRARVSIVSINPSCASNVNNAAEPVLTLHRDGDHGATYPNFVEFRMSRYATTNSVLPYTQLDICLNKDDALIANTLPVLSLKDDGSVQPRVAYRAVDGTVGLAGTKTYYVADGSGGAVTRKLTFKDGLLVAET